MEMSAKQAAKAVGKSVPTITKAIKNGTISATPFGAGWKIDAAELYRVFPPVSADGKIEGKLYPDALPNLTPEKGKGTEALEVENKMLRELVSTYETTVNDLRGRLDSEADERRRLTLMLTDQRKPEPAQAPAPKTSWWSRVFGA